MPTRVVESSRGRDLLRFPDMGLCFDCPYRRQGVGFSTPPVRNTPATPRLHPAVSKYIDKAHSSCALMVSPRLVLLTVLQSQSTVLGPQKGHPSSTGATATRQGRKRSRCSTLTSDPYLGPSRAPGRPQSYSKSSSTTFFLSNTRGFRHRACVVQARTTPSPRLPKKITHPRSTQEVRSQNDSVVSHHSANIHSFGSKPDSSRLSVSTGGHFGPPYDRRQWPVPCETRRPLAHHFNVNLRAPPPPRRILLERDGGAEKSHAGRRHPPVSSQSPQTTDSRVPARHIIDIRVTVRRQRCPLFIARQPEKAPFRLTSVLAISEELAVTRTAAQRAVPRHVFSNNVLRRRPTEEQARPRLQTQPPKGRTLA